jgi:hypothetical protein
MRTILQVIGTLSASLSALIVAGTLATTPVLAGPPPVEPIVANCTNCCECTENDQTCRKNSVAGRDCDNFTCSCTCYWSGVNNAWMCKK